MQVRSTCVGSKLCHIRQLNHTPQETDAFLYTKIPRIDPHPKINYYYHPRVWRERASSNHSANVFYIYFWSVLNQIRGNIDFFLLMQPIRM